MALGAFVEPTIKVPTGWSIPLKPWIALSADQRRILRSAFAAGLELLRAAERYVKLVNGRFEALFIDQSTPPNGSGTGTVGSATLVIRSGAITTWALELETASADTQAALKAWTLTLERLMSFIAYLDHDKDLEAYRGVYAQWYLDNAVRLDAQSMAWKDAKYSFTHILDELANKSSIPISIFADALSATQPPPPPPQNFSTQRELVYYLANKRVNGPYGRMVFVADSLSSNMVRNDGGAGPLV
jgi:hypothetical protein